MSELVESETAYLASLLTGADQARRFLEWMERSTEALAPERMEALGRDADAQFTATLTDLRGQLGQHEVPSSLRTFGDRCATAFEHTFEAHRLLVESTRAPFPQSFAGVLGAWHHAARANEIFYLVRLALKPFATYWPIPENAIDSMSARDTTAPTGVVHMSKGGYHAGFSWYVPEYYTADRAWPIIVALHGGSGNGRDFLWIWLREARRRGYILVAPTATNDTWSEQDDQGLLQILNWLAQRYNIDAQKILLTGLSDGATYTLLLGLAHPRVYRALAPLCGVLHPANELVGNLERAKNVPIYLVHGALDFLFPIGMARAAEQILRQAGAAVTYRELPDLSHTYPRSENELIMDWFESLPPR